jgi:hypothetical protein
MTQNNLQYPCVPSDTCYLYILDTGEKQHQIGMAGKPNLDACTPLCNTNEKNNEAKVANLALARLVYYRHFDDTLTALAYNRLLENMAPRSVEYLKRRSNPDMETLQLQ